MNIDFRDKKTLSLIIAAGTLVLLTAAIIAIFVLFPAKKIEIPDFAMKTKIEVDTWVVENDLSEEQVLFSYEFNESITKDVVTTQSILAGETLRKDDVLTLTLSNGSDPELILTLPDFINQKHNEIEAWFIENKFTDVTYEYIPDPKIKKDLFIKTNITEKDVRRNTPILVSISVGTESVGIDIDMPDFKDYTKANIQAWAKTNNITVTFKEEASEKIASGKLISQDPKAGTKTKTGGKVTVTLSSGKGATAIKFDGKKKADVDAWAKENNIKITYQETYDNKVANGIVISNTPNSGTIKTGSTMTVKISVGKPSIDNYTNKSKDSFAAHIDALNKKDAKLKFTVTEVDSNKTPGTILKQTINNKVVTAATTVDTGTTVLIEVAKTELKNVPSYAGKSEATFKSEIVSTYKMKVGSGSSKFSDVVTGLIISNDTGNKSIGTSINYIVSKGPYAYVDSDYNGKTKVVADGVINSKNNDGAGISIKYNESFHDTVATGITYGCSYSGKVVTCNLSKGKSVEVKNYVGSAKPCSTASCTIDSLKVTTKFVDSDKDENIVLEQSIAAGTKVGENSQITLSVSNGKLKKYCPTGATGNYPECVCPNGQEYDKVNNACIVPAITSGPLPTIPLSNYDGDEYSKIVSLLTTIFNNAGFKNLNFVKLAGEIDNPDAEKSIDSIVPSPDGTVVDFSTQITIRIKGV